MIEIKKTEYDKLKEIESKFNTMKSDESFDIANKMTTNAINVNQASKQKVLEIERISKLVNEFIEKSNQIDEKSSENFKSSELSSKESENTIELIKELSSTINSIDSIFETFTDTLDSLSIANKEISELVARNDQISIQINLIAINAKIEASRAGEYGKGFAIVADEVKKLAASSKQSTLDIGKKIEAISHMTENAKEQSDKSNELIDNGIKISDDSIVKLNSLIQLSSSNRSDSIEVTSIVNNQLKDSDTIKSMISVLLEDTTKAIEGSSNNITLGNNLLDNLKRINN
jgi:methyl-accepting chemotaxis protein